MGAMPIDLQSVTMYTNFQCLFSTRLHMKFEESWPHYKAYGSNDTRGVANLDPWGLIGRNYIGKH